MIDCLLEHSDNVHEDFSNRDLFNSLHLILSEHGEFPIEEIQSRAVIHKRYYVGDGREENAFVQLSLTIPEPLDSRRKPALAEVLLNLLKSEFFYSFQQLNCTITVKITDGDSGRYNQSIHSAAVL